MNGKRCFIQLQEAADQDDVDGYVSIWGNATMLEPYKRIYGSHTEAKREIEKWLPVWPDARIVEEGEL